jgi:hypothetical protein
LESKVLEHARRKKQICVFDKQIRKEIVNLFKVHLNWHPLVHGAAFGEIQHSDATIKDNWISQTFEMHELCKKLEESWAWEYLWKNWYQPDRWTIWARAVCKDIPIINSNAIVEALWSTFKRRYLRKYCRPKLEFMLELLINQYLPNKVRLVNAHRTFQEDPCW